MRSPANVSKLTIRRSLSGPVKGLPARASGTAGNAKMQAEERPQLSLPVAYQTGRWHNQDTTNQAARKHLTDVEPGHNCLTGAGVICQQKTKRRLVKHTLVDCNALMRQRVDQGSFGRESRIKKVPVVQAVSLYEGSDRFRVGREVQARRGR